MILAELYTRNFHFTTLANSKAEALNQLRAGWAAHMRQYGQADPNYFKEMEPDIQYRDMAPGDVLRDGEKLDLRKFSQSIGVSPKSSRRSS